MLLTNGDLVLQANSKFSELAGRDPAQLPGLPLSHLFPEGSMAWNVALHTGRLATPSETRLARPDSSIPVEVTCKTLPDGRFALSCRDLSEIHAANAQLRHALTHDPVSGHVNRSAMLEALDAEIWANRPFGLLVAGLDRFGVVNDLFGEAAGNAVLRQAAQRLVELAGPEAQVGRAGADEFFIRVPAVMDLAGVAAQAAAALAQPYSLPGQEIRVTASAGGARFPADASAVGPLTAAASAAKRLAEQERSGSAVARDEQQAGILQFRALEHDVKVAAALGELRLYFQPQARASDLSPCGFEALVRWQHPTRGLISPDQFIPVAEAGGAIVDLGHWVLREACRTAVRWAAPIPISVNVSARQVEQPDFVELVEQVLAETGLPPGRLELELTEGALLRDAADTQQKLARVRALGVRLALDDFGTGFASLSTLRTFRFDRIKIDKCFVMGIAAGGRDSDESLAVVKMIAGLAQLLGIEVVAEGVESTAQVKHLREVGDFILQGYLLGRPMPVGSWAELTAGGSPPWAAVSSEIGPALTGSSGGKDGHREQRPEKQRRKRNAAPEIGANSLALAGAAKSAHGADQHGAQQGNDEGGEEGGRLQQAGNGRKLDVTAPQKPQAPSRQQRETAGQSTGDHRARVVTRSRRALHNRHSAAQEQGTVADTPVAKVGERDTERPERLDPRHDPSDAARQVELPQDPAFLRVSTAKASSGLRRAASLARATSLAHSASTARGPEAVKEAHP
jgi:diguanylate cyclase (GGDEF)-like protein